MASQSYRVTGNKRLLPNQSAGLEGRMTGLPGMLQMKERRREQAALNEYREKSLTQEKTMHDEELAFEEDQAKKEFGLEMVKTGVNVGTGLATSKTFSQYGDDISNFMKPGEMSYADSPAPAVGTMTPGSSTGGSTGGYFSKAAGALQPGNMIAGGLAGYGLSSMFGSKNDGKKALYGAGAGLLTGFLSGGISGGLSGGIGGLFGGLMS